VEKPAGPPVVVRETEDHSDVGPLRIASEKRKSVPGSEKQSASGCSKTASVVIVRRAIAAVLGEMPKMKVDDLDPSDAMTAGGVEIGRIAEDAPAVTVAMTGSREMTEVVVATVEIGIGTTVVTETVMIVAAATVEMMIGTKSGQNVVVMMTAAPTGGAVTTAHGRQHGLGPVMMVPAAACVVAEVA